MRPSEHGLTLVEAPIEGLNFTRQPYNCLERGGVDDAGKLAKMTNEELVDIRNPGMASVEEIQFKMAEYEEDWR